MRLGLCCDSSPPTGDPETGEALEIVETGQGRNGGAKGPEGATRPEGATGPEGATRRSRLRGLIEEHHGLVWRTVSRLGVPKDEVEDATQRVFIVVARRLASVEPARERSFVFGTAMRIAGEIRRSHRRRPEEPCSDTPDKADPEPTPEDALLRGEWLTVLSDLLDRLPEPYRAVLLLHDLEEMTMAEIAATLGVPHGTAASRLRRARVQFRQLISQLRDRCDREEP